MMPGERLLRGTGMSAQVVIEQRAYEYQGIPGWRPEALGPLPARGQERAALKAVYARYRADGMAILAAARRAGATVNQARNFEKELRLTEGAGG